MCVLEQSDFLPGWLTSMVPLWNGLIVLGIGKDGRHKCASHFLKRSLQRRCVEVVKVRHNHFHEGSDFSDDFLSRC